MPSKGNSQLHFPVSSPPTPGATRQVNKGFSCISPGYSEGAGGQSSVPSTQAPREAQYQVILALGEVNEVGLLAPAALLPLVEAIRQHHAALALEERALGERKHERAVNHSPGQHERGDGRCCDHRHPDLGHRRAHVGGRPPAIGNGAGGAAHPPCRRTCSAWCRCGSWRS